MAADCTTGVKPKSTQVAGLAPLGPHCAHDSINVGNRCHVRHQLVLPALFVRLDTLFEALSKSAGVDAVCIRLLSDTPSVITALAASHRIERRSGPDDACCGILPIPRIRLARICWNRSLRDARSLK
ncbi:hypothetical protein BMS3Bbin02_00804 [bacterium BMS3Bbin02]|nr:hypothetical protein BMS3Bbin02_00804 [bacterium BMS3Bbin02]